MLQEREPEARAACRELLSLQPDIPFNWWLNGYVALWAGDFAEAKANLEEAYQLRPPNALAWWRPYSTCLAITLRKIGRKDRAEELLAESTRVIQGAVRAGNQHPQLQTDLALIHAVRGEKDQALQHLEQAVRDGFAWFDWILKDRLFESLAELPRFRRLVSEMEAKVADMRMRVAEMERIEGWQ
jgi:tetratricopeptide (TPR) repeat protein